MSEPLATPVDASPPARSRRFWIVTSLITLLLLGAVNMFLMLIVVPKFSQIYVDALPGRPLPWLTGFIITARYALAIVPMAWPALGAELARERVRSALVWINLGIAWSFLQIGITVLALFMPMVGSTTGLSDSTK
jgi:hypothetical protein